MSFIQSLLDSLGVALEYMEDFFERFHDVIGLNRIHRVNSVGLVKEQSS